MSSVTGWGWLRIRFPIFLIRLMALMGDHGLLFKGPLSLMRQMIGLLDGGRSESPKRVQVIFTPVRRN